jgi:hypothetical protein
MFWSAAMDLAPKRDDAGAKWNIVAFQARAYDDQATYKNYWYTMHYSLTERQKLTLYNERAYGKGLGAKFKVNLVDYDDKIIVSYWINPNNKCHVYTPAAASKVKTITVQYNDS